MGILRTERRRPRIFGKLGSLASLVLLTFGCGTAADYPPIKQDDTTGKTDKAATTASDAGIIDVSAPPIVSDASDSDASDPVDAVGDVEAPEAEASSVDAEPDSVAMEGGAPMASGGPATCGFTACAPGAPCPDLIVDENDLRASVVISTRTFAPTDCAVVEGCITQTGTRRLLRFDTGTANIGTADLVVGNPTSGVCFQWSECHQHYHFQGFSQYTLYQTDGTTVAARGHKQSFCLEDVEQYEEDPAPDPATPFTCTSQGLHVGWEDVYPNDIDCQWVDITGVPAGNYLLTVAINTAGYLPESNYANDSATVPVTIPAQ